MAFVDEAGPMSKKRQCELLDVPRSSLYHSRRVPDKRAQDELLMREMDEIYLEEPTYGSRLLLDQLKLMGHEVGRDRVHLRRASYAHSRWSAPNNPSQLTCIDKSHTKPLHLKT